MEDMDWLRTLECETDTLDICDGRTPSFLASAKPFVGDGIDLGVEGFSGEVDVNVVDLSLVLARVASGGRVVTVDDRSLVPVTVASSGTLMFGVLSLLSLTLPCSATDAISLANPVLFRVGIWDNEKVLPWL